MRVPAPRSTEIFRRCHQGAKTRELPFSHRLCLSEEQHARLFSASTPITLPSRQYEYPIVLSRASGCRVWDTEGREYLDFAACNTPLGHSPTSVTAALAAQVATLDSAPYLVRTELHVQAVSAIRSFFKFPKALIFDSVSASAEAVSHIARRWVAQEKHYKSHDSVVVYASLPPVTSECEDVVQALDIGGRCYGSGSYQFREDERFTRQNELRPRRSVLFDNIESLEYVLGDAHIGAFVVEPIQIDAGLIFARESYLQKAAEICRQKKILFVMDERRTGFGRTGKPLYSDHFRGLNPDVVLLGSSLAGGLFPISCLLPRGNAAKLLDDVEDHQVSVLSAGALACAATKAYVELMAQSSQTVETCERIGTEFRRRLKRRIPKVDSSVVRAVRGRGLLSCIVIGDTQGAMARSVAMRMAQKGLLAPCEGNVIYLVPPITITDSELRTAALIIRKCIQQIAKGQTHIVTEDLKPV